MYRINPPGNPKPLICFTSIFTVRIPLNFDCVTENTVLILSLRCTNRPLINLLPMELNFKMILKLNPMLANFVLETSWYEYEEYKTTNNQDPQIFCTSNNFEISYLVEKIHGIFPGYTEMAIYLAVHNVSRRLSGTVKRTAFVESVVDRLLERPPLTIPKSTY